MRYATKVRLSPERLHGLQRLAAREASRRQVRRVSVNTLVEEAIDLLLARFPPVEVIPSADALQS